MIFSRATLLLATLPLVAAGGQNNSGMEGLFNPKSKKTKSSKSKSSKSKSSKSSKSKNGQDNFGMANDGVVDDGDDGDAGGRFRTGAGSIPLTLTNIRSFDGSEDVRAAPDAELLRLSGPNTYPDGLGAEGITSMLFDPNARMISNVVSDPLTLPRRERSGKSRASDMLWQWGQFMDHDIGLTEGVAEAFTITSPKCDNGDIICNIQMNRAIFHWNEGDPQTREQLNEITGFLDASSVYGHSNERAAFLRDTGNDGRMKMSTQGLLPDAAGSNLFVALPGGLDFNAADLFIAGDVRANEQLGLLAIHTLWVREHNRLARELLCAFPDSSDEQVFQMARKLVIAQIQAITYKEFLPILIGTNAPDLTAYGGFNPNVNPGVSTEFSTCAFRVGHTFLSGELLFHDGTQTTGTMSLIDLFFTPGLARANPNLIDEVLIGQTINAANAADTKVIPEVRSFLFGAPIAGEGRDLVVFNIQRGRDNGITKYNAMREGFGLSAMESFKDVGAKKSVTEELSTAYGGDIDLCDCWICGLGETPVDGGELGSLFSTVIADQFQRFMDGDRFFYLNDPDVRDPSLINIGINVDTVTLADVINRNTIPGAVGPDAMLA